MEITIELVFMVVAAVVTGVLGAVLKDKTVPARFIPVQNLVIGIITSIVAISFGLFSDVSIAIITCLAISMGVGGAYDLVKTKK